MSDFSSVQIDLPTVAEEIRELQDLLDTSASLRENDDLLPFFRARPQLTAWLGTVNADLIRPDVIAYEYRIFGRYRADILVGDVERGRFALIELEDARADSIFEDKNRNSSYWSILQVRPSRRTTSLRPIWTTASRLLALSRRCSHFMVPLIRQMLEDELDRVRIRRVNVSERSILPGHCSAPLDTSIQVKIC